MKSWDPDGSVILITTTIITSLFFMLSHTQLPYQDVNLQELLQKAFPKHTMQQKQPKEQIWEEWTDLIWCFGLVKARTWKRPGECFSFFTNVDARMFYHSWGVSGSSPLLSQLLSPGSETTLALTKVYLPVQVTDHDLSALRLGKWFPCYFITHRCSEIHGLCKHDSHRAPS